MPNHFHFLIYADDRTIAKRKKGNKKSVLSDGFRNLLSSYAQAINKQEGRTGSLFTQNTHVKCMDDGDFNYGTTCFHYIHQNAYKAGLVEKMEDWNYSSFKDYVGLRNGTLCNRKLAFEILDLNEATFYEDSYKVIDGFGLNSAF